MSARRQISAELHESYARAQALRFPFASLLYRPYRKQNGFSSNFRFDMVPRYGFIALFGAIVKVCLGSYPDIRL